MSLNIKKPRVHDLAREASARTGLSQTSVIEVALEQYLATLGAPGEDDERRRRVESTLARIDASLTEDDRRALTSDDLYDEDGLPA